MELDSHCTVKSREVQRAMLAEMRGDRDNCARHFLAAAHLELVLADDYEQAGDNERAFRARLGAASCFWRAGDVPAGTQLFDELRTAHPQREAEIQQIIDDLK